MALDNPPETPDGTGKSLLSADADPDPTAADSSGEEEIVVAQAADGQQGPVTDGVPGEPGDPGPVVELDPEALATLLLAISQGQDLEEAMGQMLESGLARANDLNATPESIEAAVSAFRATLVDIMAQGLTAEEADVAADQAFLNALQVTQEQQAGEQTTAVANALASGINVDEAIGEDTQAFEEALQAALDGGADIGEALAQAEQAQAAQDQIDAELANAAPGDALIAALASGEGVEETVGALQGDGNGDAALAFQDALIAALGDGGNVGDALEQANQAAETSALVTAEQQADEANADPLLAALASGNNDSGALGPDTSGMSPEEAAAANEAFQTALSNSLSDGAAPDAAVNTATETSTAAATATAEANAGEQGSVLAQLASGNADNLGPDTSGMSPEQAAAATGGNAQAATGFHKQAATGGNAQAAGCCTKNHTADTGTTGKTYHRVCIRSTKQRTKATRAN